MAGTKGKGGKKNRKFGRNESYCKRRASDGREQRNRERRMLRALKLGKYADRQLAQQLHKDYAVKFRRSPAEPEGPYIPVDMKVPKWLKEAA